MPGFSAEDSAHMARALRLAKRGRYTAHPNPMVGCVLVREGEVIGEGWHERTGEAHAEINALNTAGGDAHGATAYVTLEPCNHHGKTPPCVDALIDAQIAEVICAMTDPSDGNAGRGLQALADAGIRVRRGLMSTAAKQLILGFITRVQTGRPWVRLKVAASLDGATSMRSGQSQWITGPEARADVQRLRARSGAIMSGIDTVLADDPSFNVRDDAIDTGGLQPLRVVLDSNLRMPLSAGMLALPGQTLVYCIDDSNRVPLEEAGAQVLRVGADGDKVDIDLVLEDLGRRGINELLVEAGPTLAGSLITANQADELVIYQAPHIMGSETTPMLRTPAWTELTDRRTLDIIDTRRVGSDARITARFAD